MIENSYSYWGMNLVWWFIWLTLIAWIFIIPYDIPGQRKRKDTPLDILQKRFASGQITKEDYQERKAMLEIDLTK